MFKENVIKNPISFLNKEIKKNKIMYSNVEDIIIHMFFVTASGFKYKEIDGLTEVVIQQNEKQEKEMSLDSKKFISELKEKLELQKEQCTQLKEISLDDKKVDELIKDKVIPSKEVLLFLIKNIEQSNYKMEQIIKSKDLSNYKNLGSVEDYKNLEFIEEFLDNSLVHQLSINIISSGSLISNVPDNLNKELKEILDSVIFKLLNSKKKRKDMLEISKKVKYIKKIINQDLNNK